MNGYQIAIIVLMAVHVAIHLAKHGEDRGSFSVFYAILDVLVMTWLYIKAGLFS